MRCPECSQRNSVAAKKCKVCGHKFKRKPLPLRLKLSGVVLAASLMLWAGASAILPGLTDPEKNLARVAKQVAGGPAKPEDGKRLRAEFDRALRTYLARSGQQSSRLLAEKLRKLLPGNFFEIHVFDLPRALKVVEVDMNLQASDYLVMKSGSGTKVFPLSGIEVFDDARIINESAGPMLVMVGHSAGQPPHRPQIKVYALMPDDISDETDKLLPVIRGEGSARFAANGRDIVLDLSLVSLGQSERLFSTVGQTDDSTAHQHLEWKDAHYFSRYDYGSGPFTALYAVARCMRYPDLLPSHRRYLGSVGEQLVRDNQSPEAGNFKVRRLASGPDRLTYSVAGTPVSFQAEVSKAGGIWSITSVRTAGSARASSAGPAIKAGAQPTAAAVPADATVVEKSSKVASLGTAQGTSRSAAAAITQKAAGRAEPVRKPSGAKAPEKLEVARKPEPASPFPDKKRQAAAALSRVTEPEPVPTPAENAVSEEAAEISRRISARSVNLRSAPSTDARPLAEVVKGASVEIVGKHNGWYKVRYQGKEGYVFGGLVDYKKPDAYMTATITKVKPVTDSGHKPVSQSQVGDRVVIVGGIEDGKYKVKLPSGKIGYLDKDAVDVSIEAPPFVP